MRRAIILSTLGVLGLLGVFVNYVFLYIAVAALCPSMHFLGGHGEHTGSYGRSKNTDVGDEESQKEKRQACH